MKIHAAINRLVTHLLEVGEFTPMAWQASPQPGEETVAESVTGLFFWPDMPPARVLTDESAAYIANAMGQAMGLRTEVTLSDRDKRGNWIDALDTLTARAHSLNLPDDCEAWAFLNAAHNLRVTTLRNAERKGRRVAREAA